MKTFSSRKSSNMIQKEIELQKKAADAGISPKIVDYNLLGKYIVMEKLDTNLFDIMAKNNGKLIVRYQVQIVNILKKLDEIGVFHGDPNPLNFMVRKGKMYIIDFGFAKNIDSKIIKQHDSNTPNLKFMILGLILKASEIFKTPEPIKYHHLRSFVNTDEQKMFNL